VELGAPSREIHIKLVLQEEEIGKLGNQEEANAKPPHS
jgi:hypothetical protein